MNFFAAQVNLVFFDSTITLIWCKMSKNKKLKKLNYCGFLTVEVTITTLFND